MPGHLPAPILRLDDAGRVVAANDLALKLLSRREADLVGQTVGEVVVALTHQLPAIAAEHGAERIVDAHVATVGAEDRHADRCVVEGGVEVGSGHGERCRHALE